MSRPAIDVSGLPPFGFSHRAMLWWVTAGVMLIEGSMFALMMMNYLYLKGRNAHWPPTGQPPGLLWGTLNTAVLLGSLVPNELAKKAAERFDVRGVRLWMIAAILCAVAFNAIRVFEFRALNVWWDSNAYGSVVWTLLGLHTTHILTDLLDTVVLAALFFTGPLEQKRFSDVSENSFYWYFVVLAWLPIYALIYFAPRLA